MGNFFKKTAAALAVAVAAFAVDVPMTITAKAAGGCGGNHSVDLNAVDLTSESAALSGGYYYLTADLTVSKEIEIDGNVTICLNGQNISANGNSRVLFVKNGSSLTLCDCKEKGKITGGSEEKGGGVYVDNGGKFTMSGGTISDNSASHQGGGVFVNSTGTFTMTGGTISDNKVTTSAEEDTAGGAGVYTEGTFTLKNGLISANSSKYFGGGVLVSRTTAKFILENGTISDNHADTYGGGVHVSSTGTAEMNGGIIQNNTAKNGGGGISTGGGNFILNRGTISDNTSPKGGGAYLGSGTFTINGGTLSKNTASSDGGGVYMGGGDFNMTGGTLSDNGATYNGGGVYLDNGELNMSGGAIKDNTSGISGSCVFFAKTNGGKMTLNGKVTITSQPKPDGSESNVYLADGKIITIGSNFSATSPIGIHPEKQPVKCTDAKVPATEFASNVSAKNISAYFKADKDPKISVYEGEQIWITGKHDFEEEWKYNKENVQRGDEHWHICTVCRMEVDRAVHKWDSGTITKQATPTEDGEKTYTCTVCGATLTEPYSYKVPSSPTVNNTPNNGGNRTPDGEDNSITSASPNPPTGIKLALAPAALAAVWLAVAITRKRR